MSTTLTVENDQVKATWTGKKGRGSLFQVMAKGNAEQTNKLSAKEILAVFICVKACPFPIGKGKQVYKMVMDDIEAGKHPELVTKFEAMNLGELRKALVVACGEGCNAPNDMYLGIAVEMQTPAEEVSTLQGV